MNSALLLAVILSGFLAMAQDEDTETPRNFGSIIEGDQEVPENINHATEINHTYGTAVGCGNCGHGTDSSGTDSNKPKTCTTTTTTRTGSTVMTSTCTTTVTTRPPTTDKPRLSCPDKRAYELDPRYTITAKKYATQSSIYITQDFGNYELYGPQLAIDGNVDTFSHTGYRIDLKPWWRIDLLQPHIIIGFTIRNRDTNPWRLHDFEVRVGDTDPEQNPKDLSRNSLCYFHSGGGIKSKEFFSMKCSEPLLGRYLSIQIIKNCAYCDERDENYLILNEVYVYGCKP